MADASMAATRLHLQLKTPFDRPVDVVTLAQQETINPAPRHYLNRLSDLLFVLARVLNRANLDGKGGDDVYWKSERLAKYAADQAAEEAVDASSAATESAGSTPATKDSTGG